MARAARRCPECDSKRVLRIVYGFPTPAMEAAARRGEIVLGGCLVGPRMPNRACQDCGADFGDWLAAKTRFRDRPTELPPCPECGTLDVCEIIYGATRASIEWALETGSLLRLNGDPDHRVNMHCRRCLHEWLRGKAR